MKPTTPPESRFWPKVEKTEGCWIWKGSKNPNGYGYFGLRRGKGDYAHRFSYELTKGKIPPDMEIDHLCRNRLCVNPAHLEVVSHAENMRRGEIGSNNSKKTHCPKGHLLSGDNLVPSLLKKGRRQCKICNRESNRRSERKAWKIIKNNPELLKAERARRRREWYRRRHKNAI